MLYRPPVRAFSSATVRLLPVPSRLRSRSEMFPIAPRLVE